MNSDRAAAILLDEVGTVEARQIALTGQRSARRARSRKRFAFWTAVAAAIEGAREPQLTGEPGGSSSSAIRVQASAR
jgi:hypothetical protein